MRVVSVNVGRPRLVMYNGSTVSTSIFKAPVTGPRRVDRLNIEGDRQADLSVHGGVNKAVYAYPIEHYAVWAAELQRDDLTLGQFGENLSVEGMLEDAVRVGDRFRIGTVELEVSQPRVPCRNLAIRMKDAEFPKRFLKSRRSGFYFRVIEEGILDTGDEIVRTHEARESMTIRELYDVMFGDDVGLETIRRAVELPELSAEWKRSLGERI